MLNVGSTVAVNKEFVDSVLATRHPMDPNLRQTITSLERLSNTESTVLDIGWSSHQRLGTILYFIKVVPLDPTHVSYRPVQDGPGRGITIYFTSPTDRLSSFVWR